MSIEHSPDRQTKSTKSRRFVSYRELKPEFGIPFSRVWIDALIAAGKFPRKFNLTANRVGWWSDEIEAHLAGCDNRETAA